MRSFYSSSSMMMLAVMSTVTVATVAQAGIVFQQDFSSSTTATDYVNAASPNSGQFNDLSQSAGTSATFSITDDALVLEKDGTATGDVIGFNRSTDLTTSTLASARITVTANPQNSGTLNGVSAFNFGNLNTTYNGGASGSTAGKFGEFVVNYRSSGNFSIRANGVNGALVAGGTFVTAYVFLNNSASAENYIGPDGASHTVNAGTFSVFQDTAVVAENIAKLGASADLSNLRFRFVPPAIDGVSISFDEIVYADDLTSVLSTPVPEPASGLFAAMVGGGLLARRRR